MAEYEQSEIELLISCPKRVSEAPKKRMKDEGAHRRNDAKLASAQFEGEFEVFMRQSMDFPENFSIGLRYRPIDGRGEITLLRCNGKHGECNKSLDPGHPHCDYHVHRTAEESLEAGLADVNVASKTSEYACYEEALQYFVKTVNLNLKDAEKHFSANTQAGFSFEQ